MAAESRRLIPSNLRLMMPTERVRLDPAARSCHAITRAAEETRRIARLIQRTGLALQGRWAGRPRTAARLPAASRARWNNRPHRYTRGDVIIGRAIIHTQ